MKIVAENRRARFDYAILQTFEAGIVLTGQEAKSCRAGHVNLSGAYVSFLRGTPLLKHMKISPYPYAGKLPEYDPERDRVLLLKRSEAEEMSRLAAETGMAIIPLEVRAGRFIKLLLAVARGKKRVDKREAIKKRDVLRRVREGREV